MPTKPLIINIPEPCKQAWDDMRPDGQGRHCSNCQKTVTDFTAWTDAELHRFFTKNTGDVCGRFLSSQVDRAIVLPYQPHSRLYTLAIAMGLVLVFTGVPVSHARVRVRSKYEMVNKAAVPHDGKGKGAVSGKVVDEKNEPLAGAVVEVYNDDSVIDGALTDTNGFYIIKEIPVGCYNIRSKHIGTKLSVTEGIIVTNDIATTLDIKLPLEDEANISVGIIITTRSTPKKKHHRHK